MVNKMIQINATLLAQYAMNIRKMMIIIFAKYVSLIIILKKILIIAIKKLMSIIILMKKMKFSPLVLPIV